jgi:two-component system, chemotaxis family, CheB/CheR fusion protein
MPESDEQHPRLVVGIGASAGGLAAFKSFLANTPADIGMAFVLVQHLAPAHKSILVELLGAQSRLPVVAATGGLSVQENCVYVIPPDATLTIQDGVLHLVSPAPVREHRRPIDSFFVSLAEDCGERAVGIVLAGVGSDGTAGIRSIKEHGGLTLAQAEFDATALQGMPSSAVATGLVDHVIPVEGMPDKLIVYLKHMTEVANSKDRDGNRRDLREHLGSITSILHARSTHDFKGYKEPTLMRRIQRRMQVLHIETATDYIERLRTDATEITALFQELLIGVTQFFRDPDAFEALKATALVPILSTKSEDDTVRVWVAGCSTGEEVYSMAILIRETLQDRRLREIKIFGTDIDPNAVALARSGRYLTGALRLSPERLKRWFVKEGVNYSPVPEIRDMCVFSTHSLVKDPPFSKLDLISCRNVLIYLGEDLQDRIMRTFHYALRTGGYLFLGTSESVTRSSRLFTPLDKKYRVLQRRDKEPRLPAVQSSLKVASEPVPSPLTRRPLAEDRTDKAVERLMKHYTPAYFVIDRNHEITRFSGAETGNYIEPTQGTASLNLFSILHKTLRPTVRAAVNEALESGKRIINENLTIRINGEVRALALIVEPIGGDNISKAGAACVVAFRDSSPLNVPDATEVVATSDANTQELERELLGTKTQLQAASDELETRIEDMKSTTEEFQAVNEELQSSNEELETAKEEMQSVNEELQTINAELNNKNDLLIRLNSDMQNLLESTQIATVFLDDQLRIKHFTPALMQLFPVRDSDQGRSITDIVSLLDYNLLQSDVEKVRTSGTVLERDVALKDGGRSFSMRIRPYRTVGKYIEGVVVTFVDITARKSAEARQAFLSRELEHRTQNLLAVISSIAKRSLANGRSLDEAREVFTGRLETLSHANEMLTETSWQGTALRDLAQRGLAAFSGRYSIKGEAFVLNPDATQGFALIIHELCTNASKYGAFSVPSGQVTISWSINAAKGNPRFVFRWQEHGGPPVSKPTRTSFGSRLLQESIKGLDHPAEIDYAADGLIYSLDAPLAVVAADEHASPTSGGEATVLPA